MDYLQADNEMKTFAALTGGASYFPRFQGEYADDIFGQINQNIRSKYRTGVPPDEREAGRHVSQIAGGAGGRRRASRYRCRTRSTSR
jgi:hypothetical protein